MSEIYGYVGDRAPSVQACKARTGPIAAPRLRCYMKPVLVRVLDPFVGLGYKYSHCGTIQAQFATALSL